MKKGKKEHWVRKITEVSEVIRENVTGLAWVVEVEVDIPGQKEKGSIKYSEARGIHYSDKKLADEDEAILYFMICNLTELAKHVVRDFLVQCEVDESLAKTLQVVKEKKPQD